MMDRLQKKCAIASTALHASLIGILLFGAALMPEPTEPPFKPLTVYSADKVSDALSSGGNPNAQVAPQPPALINPPQQTQPVSQPQPPQPPPPKQQAEPPKPRVEPKPMDLPRPKPADIPREDKSSWFDHFKFTKTKPVEPQKEADETPRHKHEIVLDPNSSKLYVRKYDTKAKAEREAAEAAEAQANAARHDRATKLASAYRNIAKKISSDTVVDMPGVGTPGEMSVNYRDLIASVYYNAWAVPTDLDDSAVVLARVTIARSGNVISARVVKSSGNSVMDRSVANVLQAVTFIEAFPAGSSDQERTVTIKFTPSAMRGTG